MSSDEKPVLRPERTRDDLVRAALVREGLPVDGDRDGRIERLEEHYNSCGGDVFDCDECGYPTPAIEGESEPPPCHFCGYSEGATEDRSSVAIAPSSPSSALALPESGPIPAGAEEQLDAAIRRYATGAREMAAAGWDMGDAAREIDERKLYLARRDRKGQPIFRTFDDFARAELGRSGAHTRQLIRMATTYTREQAVAIGESKLSLLSRVADPEKRAALLPAAETSSLRALATKVREANVGEEPRPDRLGRKRGRRGEPKIVAPFMPRAEEPAENEAKEAPKRRITLSIEEGPHKVKLWGKKSVPTAPKRRAQTLADCPTGKLTLPNGTRISIRIGRSEGEEGGLYAELTAFEVDDG